MLRKVKENSLKAMIAEAKKVFLVIEFVCESKLKSLANHFYIHFLSLLFVLSWCLLPTVNQLL